LETLLAHDPNLLELINPSNGYYPLHSAISATQVECAAWLLEHGAAVNQTIAKLPHNIEEYQTVFHLAAKQLALDRLKPILPVQSDGLTLVRVHAMLDLLLANLSQEAQFSDIVDGDLGSVIHYFATVDYAAGISQLAAGPNKHLSELKNQHNETPLLLAIKSNSFATAHQLLALNVDIDKDVLQLIAKKWLRKKDEVTQGELTRIIEKLLDKGNVMPDKNCFSY
jgi:ankyrin repeat protein